MKSKVFLMIVASCTVATMLAACQKNGNSKTGVGDGRNAKGKLTRQEQAQAEKAAAKAKEEQAAQEGKDKPKDGDASKPANPENPTDLSAIISVRCLGEITVNDKKMKVDKLATLDQSKLIKQSLIDEKDIIENQGDYSVVLLPQQSDKSASISIGIAKFDKDRVLQVAGSLSSKVSLKMESAGDKKVKVDINCAAINNAPKAKVNLNGDKKAEVVCEGMIQADEKAGKKNLQGESLILGASENESIDLAMISFGSSKDIAMQTTGKLNENLETGAIESALHTGDKNLQLQVQIENDLRLEMDLRSASEKAVLSYKCDTAAKTEAPEKK